MLRNQLKATLRNVVRNKACTTINITGLAIGIAVCMMIMLWVQFELSYDKFNENADTLYRVNRETVRNGNLRLSSITPDPLGPALKSDIPEIIRSTRYDDLSEQLILYNEERYVNNKGALVDSDFFEMFSLPFLRGDHKTALSTAKSVVISENLRQKVFGSADPIGKILNIDHQDYTVTGIFNIGIF